jgi:hypothetical protein
MPLAAMPTSTSDFKHPTMDQEKADRMFITPPRRSRPLAIGFAVVALLYFSWSSLVPIVPWTARLGGMPCTSTQLTGTKSPVPLEAHIMSKCPDARDCLRMLVLPTMQQVYNKVNFTLSFIGTYVAVPYPSTCRQSNIVLVLQIMTELHVCMAQRNVWAISSSSALRNYIQTPSSI